MEEITHSQHRAGDSPQAENLPPADSPADHSGDLLADRRHKLELMRDTFGIDPFGRRVDGLITLAEARSKHSPQADQRVAENPQDDSRAFVKVAGRVMQRRVMGGLIFMTLRDATGDLQIAVTKKAVSKAIFKLAKSIDLGDLVVVQGSIGKTKTGEVTIWAAPPPGDAPSSMPGGGNEKEGDNILQLALDNDASPLRVAVKSLALPPGKWHGLQDTELRYRKRYVDLYANPDVMATMMSRCRLVNRIRAFLTDPPPQLGPGYVEVETPMMQSIPGGAAARPFVTHHNALNIDLYLRIAPELYLKRLLVGGMQRVFEINRNFRNEGLSPRHNPEFTMLELYQAFGDYRSMMALTEQLIHTLAQEIGGQTRLPFGDYDGDQAIDYTLPFKRATYHELFEQHNGFSGADYPRLIERARQLEIDPTGMSHDALLQEVWETTVEKTLIQPTFVMDYPASLCPLTKSKRDNPTIAERFELYVAGMEIANAYTELNDPDIQEANFSQQVAGLSDEEAMFRNPDHDFVEALRVGMPPAGGLGIGIDRLVMLITNSRSIRDVILFPLMRPVSARDTASENELRDTPTL